jgi:predicted outer membrane lipoprotein
MWYFTWVLEALDSRLRSALDALWYELRIVRQAITNEIPPLSTP